MDINWAGQDYFSLFTLAYALLELIAIAAALEAILKTRTAQGAIAWFLSLIFMPLLVLPLFLVFGSRRFQGY